MTDELERVGALASHMAVRLTNNFDSDRVGPVAACAPTMVALLAASQPGKPTAEADEAAQSSSRVQSSAERPAQSSATHCRSDAVKRELDARLQAIRRESLRKKKEHLLRMQLAREEHQDNMLKKQVEHAQRMENMKAEKALTELKIQLLRQQHELGIITQPHKMIE
ncbi:hypothetical protein HPB50_007406 [Hyalomma asiaticum]|uniref:Uncharacterized protein n=1 Tax=Hyalomma asiaticum TaxID=266040 RepID=A0ACB7RHS3_HYAAI|nr:hypothetical protein HPB50_007406 [Hyalomma asiaticum]